MIPHNYNHDLFYIVLQYLYTREICFTLSNDTTVRESEIPTTCEVEGIYEIAHYLGIECLQRKALTFLQATCNIQNITARTFGNFAEKYQQVAKVYDKYFMDNWDGKVRVAPEFEGFFRNVQDPDEDKRINFKFRKMMSSKSLEE